MNDIDVAGRLSRDIFEEKSASVLERARAPLQKVLSSFPVHHVFSQVLACLQASLCTRASAVSADVSVT